MTFYKSLHENIAFAIKNGGLTELRHLVAQDGNRIEAAPVDFVHRLDFIATIEDIENEVVYAQEVYVSLSFLISLVFVHMWH